MLKNASSNFRVRPASRLSALLLNALLSHDGYTSPCFVNIFRFDLELNHKPILNNHTVHGTRENNHMAYSVCVRKWPSLNTINTTAPI